jgi:hypothetical protein
MSKKFRKFAHGRISLASRRMGLLTFARDAGGSVAVAAAVIFPVLIGGMGLGAEVGYWYLTERRLQHTADIAAYAAAIRLYEDDDDATLEEVALHVAEESGLSFPDSILELHHPPLTGPNAGDDDMVEVTIDTQVDRFFTQLFAENDEVSISSRSVARVVGGTVCALALSGSANNALHASSSANVTFENCMVASNSSSASAFHMQGATMNVDCVYVVGTYKTTGGSNNLNLSDCEEVQEGHDAIDDPYAGVAYPTTTTACVNPGTLENTTVTPTLTHSSGVPFVRYCSLSVKGNVTFNPGLYLIDGTFSNTGVTSLSGSNVTFVVGGNVTLNGNLTMNLAAPTSGPFSGILLFGDRDATSETIRINGNASTTLKGAVYFPTGNLNFTGSSSASDGCTQVIANTIEFTGNSGIRSSCEGAGIEAIRAGDSLVRLFE